MAGTFDYNGSLFPDEGQPANPPPTFSLDFWADCTEPSFDEFVSEVRRRMQNAFPMKRWSSDRTPVLRLMLCNLIQSHARRPGQGTRFYLKPQNYTGKSRYRPESLTGKVLRGVVKALEAAGLIFFIRGKWNPIGALRTMSQAAPTDELIALWIEHGVSADMIRRSAARPLIVLRSPKRRGAGANKRSSRLVEPPPPGTVAAEHLAQAAQRLARINTFLRQFTLSLPDDARKMDQDNGDLWSVGDGCWVPAQASDAAWLVDLNSTDLTRIYNNVTSSDFRLDRGGRFYGAWWQSIRSEDRTHITIDGEPTVELDYANLHPRMIYHQAGIDVSAADLYELPALAQLIGNYDPATLRTAVKALWQVVINSTARQLATIRRGDHDDLCDRWKIELPVSLHPAKVIELIREQHSAVSNSLGIGIGLRLQALDSEICERILLSGKFHGLPILPIHDSFVVRRRDEEFLRFLMTKHYRQRLGFNPVIKRVTEDNLASPVLAWSNDEVFQPAGAAMEEEIDFPVPDLVLDWKEAE